MKRIWFLWLGAAYVLIHTVTIPLQLYKGQYFFAVIGVVASVVVGRLIWQRRDHFVDPKEYQ